MGRLRWLAVSGLLLGTSPCIPEYPGEPVGSFEITGSLDENTCGGQAVPARDPLVFFAEVREEGGEAFWRRPNAPIVNGTVDTDGTYRFRSSSRTTLIAPDEATQTTGCFVDQTELVQARVVSGIPADAATPGDGGISDGGATAALEGTHEIEITPVPGSDCTGVLAVSGGTFLALPCRVRYDLIGTPTDPF